MKKVDEERAKERVENLKKCISNFLCEVGFHKEMFQYECDVNEWNDEVLSEISEACEKLGFSLASLVNWYDEEEKDEDKK